MLSLTAKLVGARIGSVGHLWTLAIEGQFKLVWPVVLLLTLYARRRWVALAVLLAIGVASAMLRHTLS